MKTRTHLVALVAAAVVALGGAGAALAAQGTPPAGGPTGSGPRGGPPGAAAIASYLGLSGSQIQTDLKDGETLAQIAVAQGKTAAGLEAAIIADATTHLQAAVTAGTLTSAQETTMLAALQSQVDQMVNSTGPPAGCPGGPGGSAGPKGSGLPPAPQGSSGPSSTS